MSTLSLPLPQGFSTLHDIDAFRCYVACGNFGSVGKPCVSLPSRLLCHRGFQRFTILMRSDATLRAELSDNLAGDKRLIVLIISVLQQIIAARSYEKTYNLAGIGIVYICRNLLSVNTLRYIGVPTSPARLSDI